jgi:hypothetical protein
MQLDCLRCLSRTSLLVPSSSDEFTSLSSLVNSPLNFGANREDAGHKLDSQSFFTQLTLYHPVWVFCLHSPIIRLLGLVNYHLSPSQTHLNPRQTRLTQDQRKGEVFLVLTSPYRECYMQILDIQRNSMYFDSYYLYLYF